MNFDYDALIQQNIFFLYAGLISVAIGVILFETQPKKTISIALVMLGAISVRVFVVMIDPFLHMWDEQVHALVAKNMMDSPFTPALLKDPLLYYDFKNWSGNNIWLHKQPFFLWQIALSFKIFGVNEFSLRLPDILMSGIVVLFIYRIGIIALNKRAGLYGAVLFAGSYYLIDLTAGRMPTDHNDIAFVFYVTASLWAWFEYYRSKSIYWVLLIGLFSGIAILVKWLTGLLVYSGWALSVLLDKKLRRNRKSYYDFLISLLITIVVALPWQIYILIRFPIESRFEFAFNSRHFYEALERHSGTWLYHFESAKEIFGDGLHVIIFASVIIFCFIRIPKIYKIPLLTWVLSIYIFFTLAATKMMGFTLPVSPLMYVIFGIVIAYFIDWAMRRFTKKPIARRLVSVFGIVFILFLFFSFIKHDKLSLEKLTNRKATYDRVISTTMFYKELPGLFPDGEYIFFNPRPYDNLKIIFYTGQRSRSRIPSEKEIEKLKDHQINIVVFDNEKLPDYILNDTTIAKVKSFVWMNQYKGKHEIYF